MKSTFLDKSNIIIYSVLWMIVFLLIMAGNDMPNIRLVFKINLIFSSLLLIIFISVLIVAYIINNEILKLNLVDPGLLFITGNIGTIITSTIVLAIDLTMRQNPSGIFIGVGEFFYALMLLSFIYFIYHIVHNERLLKKPKKDTA
jgi:hypothetical protein